MGLEPTTLGITITGTWGECIVDSKTCQVFLNHQTYAGQLLLTLGDYHVVSIQVQHLEARP